MTHESVSCPGKLSICPNEMVPLQIDRAIDLGRYLRASSPNRAG
jgi:hypothetical protein